VRCPEGLPLAGCPAGNYGVACVNLGGEKALNLFCGIRIWRIWKIIWII
jgi:hypothetical protein